MGKREDAALGRIPKPRPKPVADAPERTGEPWTLATLADEIEDFSDEWPITDGELVCLLRSSATRIAALEQELREKGDLAVERRGECIQAEVEVERLRTAIAKADEALSNANPNDGDMLYWVDVAWHALVEVRPETESALADEGEVTAPERTLSERIRELGQDMVKRFCVFDPLLNDHLLDPGDMAFLERFDKLADDVAALGTRRRGGVMATGDHICATCGAYPAQCTCGNTLRSLHSHTPRFSAEERAAPERTLSERVRGMNAPERTTMTIQGVEYVVIRADLFTARELYNENAELRTEVERLRTAIAKANQPLRLAVEAMKICECHPNDIETVRALADEGKNDA